MNEFVDYSKRGITLPGGCKDLIDVLRLGEPASRPGHRTGGLADVEGYIASQLAAAPKFSNLLILWGHATNNIQVALIEGVLNVITILEPEAPAEAAVRQVFERAGIALVADEPLKTLALPIQLFRYRLPGTAAGPAAALIRDLLRSGYGVPEAARLEFYYVEGRR